MQAYIQICLHQSTPFFFSISIIRFTYECHSTEEKICHYFLYIAILSNLSVYVVFVELKNCFFFALHYVLAL